MQLPTPLLAVADRGLSGGPLVVRRSSAPREAFVPVLRNAGTVRVALCVPLRGSEGIWGPSCIASAELPLPS